MYKSFFVALALTLLSLLALAACQSSSRPTITIYSPHGEDLLEAFKAKFEAAHPGVKVQYLDLGSQEIYDRIKLEQANPQADIWWGASSITFERAASEGLLEPYRPSWADKLNNDLRDDQDRWYGTFLTPEVIVYNREAVKLEESPKDWDDVIDPKWRGKLLIRDPIPSDTMRTIFGAMILRQWQNSNSPQQGYDWLRKLDANTKEYTVNSALMIQKLARQEGLISVWNLPDVALSIYRDNLPLAFNVPSSGTPIVIDGIAVVKGTRQPELARQFYEFATNEENLLLAARDFYHPPLRTDIDRAKLPAWLAQVDIKIMPVDKTRFQSEIQQWMQYWDSQIRNQNNH
ncbi:MAG: extracellular solute-binding protein [Acidobacteriota bacterium]